MGQVGLKIAFAIVAVTMLSACQSIYSKRSAVDATIQVPASVSFAPLQYSWNTNY